MARKKTPPAPESVPAGEPAHLGELPPPCPSCQRSNLVYRHPPPDGDWWCNRCATWLVKEGYVPPDEEQEKRRARVRARLELLGRSVSVASGIIEGRAVANAAGGRFQIGGANGPVLDLDAAVVELTT